MKIQRKRKRTNIWKTTFVFVMGACLFHMSSIFWFRRRRAIEETAAAATTSSSSSCSTTTAVDAPIQVAQLPIFRHAQEFIASSGTTTTHTSPVRVCAYFQDKISIHFAHAMQQLYSCWSIWQQHPDRKPILILQKEKPASLWEAVQIAVYNRRNKDNPFLNSFWKALQDVLGVQIVSNPSKELQAQALWAQRDNPWLDGYQMVLGDNQKLRDQLLGTSVPGCPSPPRIAILNRNATRSILNVLQLQLFLQEKLQHPVQLQYFEGLSFHQQIDFFSRVDLLVSPHGAQLTGIPFMPPCGGVLEIFPHGYLLPQFFGSLAAASQLDHSFLYLGNNYYYTKDDDDDIHHINNTMSAIEKVQSTLMKDPRMRSRSRKEGLCPHFQRVWEGIQRMKLKWEQCCEKQKRT